MKQQKSGKRHWLLWVFLLLCTIATSSVVAAGFFALPGAMLSGLTSLGNLIFVPGVSTVWALLLTIVWLLLALIGLFWILIRFVRR